MPAPQPNPNSEHAMLQQQHIQVVLDNSAKTAYTADLLNYISGLENYIKGKYGPDALEEFDNPPGASVANLPNRQQRRQAARKPPAKKAEAKP